jgi:hypothetical protein
VTGVLDGLTDVEDGATEGSGIVIVVKEAATGEDAVAKGELNMSSKADDEEGICEFGFSVLCVEGSTHPGGSRTWLLQLLLYFTRDFQNAARLVY